MDASGKRIEQTVATWISTLAQLKSWGLDEDQARTLANEAFDDRGKQRSLSNYRRNKYEDWNSLLRNAAEEMLRRTPLNTQASGNTRGAGGNTSGGSGTQSTSTRAPEPSSGVSGRTTTIMLTDGKVKAKALVNESAESRFINLLQSARSVS